MDCSTPGIPCPSPTYKSCSNSCSSNLWCHPTISSSVIPFSSFLQSFPASKESLLHITWPKYWSFSFSIIPSSQYSEPISFRMDWLDLLAVQGTLKSLLQHHSSKASILQHSAFFTVQLSHPYMTTGKTVALTRLTFVGKVMSLLLNMQESSRKTSTSALLMMPKPLTVWIAKKCGKFWKRWEYQTTWPASWETVCRSGSNS